MKRLYKFAGVELEVDIPDQWMYDEERFLAEFRVENAENPHQFQFEIKETLAAPSGSLLAAFPDYRVYGDFNQQSRYIGTVAAGWENAYIRAQHVGREHFVQVKAGECRSGIGVKTVLNSMAAEHLVIEENGVVFHASFIEVGGKAILFTAPSGTGKSTQADLWAKLRGAEIINGDRAVIRLVDGQPFACGIPFAGSSKHCKNAELPLAAIVYLGQAPVTSICRLKSMEAFKKVWGECTVNTWNPDDLNKAIDIVQQITSRVLVFELPCTPDESAVIALEEMLGGSVADSVEKI